jgi:hypothetical protein
MSASAPFPTPAIAWFISPHGFGHAARSCAVIEAVHARRPQTVFHLYTSVTQRFFTDSLSAAFAYHLLETDVGMVQKTPFEEDLPATIERLKRFYPCDPELVADLARQVMALNCRLIVCDIAPLGIAVGRRAGITTLLVENFTWDWVYAGYRDYRRALQPFCHYLGELFAAVDYHLQTRPVCRPGSAHITTGPISRRARTDAGTLRRGLGIPPGARMVVVTLGGTSDLYAFSDFSAGGDIFLVVPGSGETLTVRDRVLLLPTHSGFFHPDLMHAADAVVGKAGYSTLAEVYAAGVPFGYVTRTGFRESAILENFVARHMPSLEISEDALAAGLGTDLLTRLLALPRASARKRNAAGDAAAFICRILGEKG